MKLRIKGDSVRLRLTQTEVAALANDGAVSDTMHLAPGLALRYGLGAHDGSALAARLGPHELFVLVPRAWLRDWPDSDRVGFEGAQDAGNGRTLRILVEKDFQCLHKRPDEEDAYPHPLADAHGHASTA